jgi:hypothetical protein
MNISIILLSIIGYIVMWSITSSLFYIRAIKDYKMSKQNYCFKDWYSDSDYVNFVPLSGLFWPLFFWIAIFCILSNYITNKIEKYYDID